MDWKERCKTTCSCKQDIVAFICKDANCVNRMKQPFYCMNCIVNAVHPHQSVFISDEIQEYVKKWASAKKAFEELHSAANKQYNSLKPLILYYEHESLLVPVIGQPQNLNLAANLTAKITALNLAAAEFQPIFRKMEALLNA